MALATRCPNCHALFRVAADQLKLRGGLVRCGACREVFDATGTLSYIDDVTASTPEHTAAPAVGTVIAAIRKAESTASGSLDGHLETPASPEPGLPTADALPSAEEPQTGVPAEAESTVVADTLVEEGLAAADQQGLTEQRAEVAAGVAATDAGRTDEAEPAGVPSVEDETADTEPVTPSFLREADAQKKRRRQALFSVGTLLLLALLLTQLAVAFRSELLARFPQARPALEGLCKAFRCTVDWPARGDLLAVVGSELQALPGTSAYELTAVVRNRGSMTLALPAIELTLSDTLNRSVARKVFSPADYLAGESDPGGRMRAGLEPGADLTVRIAFEARDVNAAGFVVYPFYL
jgi:predicted Zn finger-like uncharacterized protein